MILNTTFIDVLSQIKRQETMMFAGATNYTVTTYTSNERLADTNGDVFLSIIGTKGNTTEHEADNPGDDRQRGSVDTYVFSDGTDIGDFQCVFIRLHYTTLIVLGDWIIEKVFLEAT